MKIIYTIFFLIITSTLLTGQVVMTSMNLSTTTAPAGAWAADDFERASLGSNWTTIRGTFAITGNSDLIATTGTTESGTGYNAVSFAADQISVVVYGISGNDWYGPAVRCSSSAAYYYGFYAYSSGNYELFRNFGDTWTTMASGDFGTFSVGDSLKLIAKGDSLIAWWNTTRVVGIVYSGADKLTSGRPGVTSYTAASNGGVESWYGQDL